MTPESVFKIANSLALLAWLLLIVLGRKRWVSGLVTAVLAPGVFALAYVAIFAAHSSESTGNFNTLAGVSALFSNPWLLLAGWIHYLAFDLFTGSWQVRDAARQGISHWLVIPCLILTFLLGPAGLLLYFVLRASLRRQLQVG